MNNKQIEANPPPPPKRTEGAGSVDRSWSWMGWVQQKFWHDPLPKSILYKKTEWDSAVCSDWEIFIYLTRVLHSATKQVSLNRHCEWILTILQPGSKTRQDSMRCGEYWWRHPPRCTRYSSPTCGPSIDTSIIYSIRARPLTPSPLPRIIRLEKTVGFLRQSLSSHSICSTDVQSILVIKRRLTFYFFYRFPSRAVG